MGYEGLIIVLLSVAIWLILVCLFCNEKQEVSTLDRRSPQWTSFRNEFLKRHPICAACDRTSKLEVHHIKPFHTHPELELDTTNLVTLCEFHHLVVGHKGNWNDINDNVLLHCVELRRIYRHVIR